MIGYLQTIINLIQSFTQSALSYLGYAITGIINMMQLTYGYSRLILSVPAPILWVGYLFFNVMLIRFICTLGRRG